MGPENRPPQTIFSQGWMQDALRVVLIALLYFAAHQIAFLFPDTEQVLAAVWPAGGIGLAALLLNRRRLWIPILVGMFIAGNTANLLVGRPLFNSLGFMTANVLESLLCAWAIIYWCGENVTFTRVREMLALIFAATVVNAGTALIGAGTAALASVAPFWSFWETWWIADGLGIFIIAPLIVAWLRPRESFLPPQWRRILESGLFLALWSVVTWLAFQGDNIHSPLSTQSYILVVLLAYAALRFSLRGTTSAIVIMWVILISSKSVSVGPIFSGGDTLRDRVLLAQMFIASITVTGYLLNSTFTERKRADEALKASEQRLGTVLENIHDAVWSADLSGQYDYLSPIMETIYGRPIAELKANPNFWIESAHPEDIGRVRASGKNLLRDGRVEIEYRCMRPDGTARWILDRKILIRDENEKPLRIAGVISDITERKQAENTLRESEARLLEAQFVTKVGSWETDLSTLEVIWSAQTYKILDLDQNTFHASHPAFLGFVHPEDRKKVEEAFSNSFDSSAYNSIEHRIVTAKGVTKYVEERWRILHNDQEQALRAIGTCQDITERVQAEEALRDAYWRTESIIEGTQVGTWEWNVQTGETVFNEKWAQIIGYTLDELAPVSIKTWEKFAHPDDLKQSAELLERHFAGELPNYDYESRMKHKDGHWVWVLDRGRVITRTTDGKPLMMFGTHQDITARKQAEYELRESEARFREVLENSLDASYKRNLQTNTYDYLSPIFAQITGYTPEEFVNFPLDTVLGLMHPDDIPEVDRVIAKSLSDPTKNENRMDYRMKHKVDGEYHWLHDQFNVMRDAHGQPIALIGSVRDITERKQAEKAIHQRVMELELLYESGLAFSQLLSPKEIGQKIIELLSEKMNWHHTAIRLVNQHGEDLKLLVFDRPGLEGEAEAQLVEARLSESIIGFDKGLTGLAFQQSKVVRTGDVNSDPHYVESYPGIHSGLYVPLKSWNRILGVISIESEQPNAFSDADEKLIATLANQAANAFENARLYEEIDRHVDTLEQRVKERTSELRDAQEQLVRHERLVVMGQLAGSVGHELRNPLAVIANAVYFLKLTQTDASDKVREYLDMIANEVRTSDKIVTDLLEFARIKSVERQPVAASELIRQTFERFPAPARVEMTLEIPADLPPVYADPQHVIQILGNLTVNACQSMPEGGKLNIFVNAQNAQDGMIMIAVQDNGMGITPEDMGKLFEPLFTTKTKGVGLGLAVSQKLAEANDGRIEVQSEPGKGSTFNVYLPAYKADSRAGLNGKPGN